MKQLPLPHSDVDRLLLPPRCRGNRKRSNPLPSLEHVPHLIPAGWPCADRFLQVIILIKLFYLKHLRNLRSVMLLLIQLGRLIRCFLFRFRIDVVLRRNRDFDPVSLHKLSPPFCYDYLSSPKVGLEGASF